MALRSRLPHSSWYRCGQRLVLTVAIAVALVPAGLAATTAQTATATGFHPYLQNILDGLVTGPQRVAPGVTAYVLGSKGTWAGSAGIANVKTGEAMQPSTRLRIQSNSKPWLMVVIFQLVNEGRMTLDDTVARWLPGLLPYGNKVTVRQLMSDTSGLIDDNDIANWSPAQSQKALARVKDAKLRSELLAIAARVKKDPTTHVDPIWFVRYAAWQPLLFRPGSRYHHSNIGWNIAGFIAARAGGKPLPALYTQRIFVPLHLLQTAYQPQGPISGPHAEGYEIGPSGTLVDATAWTFGKGADGAIVTDAAEEGTFLEAVLDGRLHVREQFLAFYNSPGTDSRACPGNSFLGQGAGAASRSYVHYNQTGTHVAVLLLNGFRSGTGATGDATAEAAARELYCSA